MNFILNNTEHTLFEKVEQAKQQWESAVDALPELICIVDLDGCIMRSNLTIERWTGVPVTTIKGKRLHDLLHPNCSGDCTFDDFWQSAKPRALAGEPVKEEYHDDFLDKCIELRFRRVDEQNRPIPDSLVVLIHDITERNRMERELRRHAKRLEVMNDISGSILAAKDTKEIATVILEHCHELAPYNQAWFFSYEAETDELCPLTAFSAEEGDPIEMSVSNRSFPKLKECEQLKDTFILNFDLINQPPPSKLTESLGITSGSILNVRLAVDQRLIGNMVLVGDEPGAFDQSHQDVITEVAELLTVAMRQVWFRQRLEKSNEELQTLLKINHEQLQNVTHELRSPLALIKGYTEMLRDGLMGPLTKEQKDTLAILDNKGDQLLFMVQRLFTLQTINRDNLQKQRIPAYQLLLEVVNTWQVFAANKEIILRIDAPQDLAPVFVDIDLMTQVLSNLLDNAMKFSSAGDSITISGVEEEDQLVIGIQDQGQGIPKEKQKNLFDRYFQVDKGSSKSKLGAGIGLALCKAVVTAHDGEIWVESEGIGQGTTFYFSLPMAE